MSYPPASGPYIIGAIGGSGTRVVAGILRQSGVFIGTNLNGPLDALDFAEYCLRWIPTFTSRETHPLSPAVFAEMRQHLRDVVDRHCASIGDTGRAWGWKNSGNLYLLPFFHGQFPELKFLHVVRDGRDMAYSANQYQVRQYGSLLLKPEEQRRSQPLRSIALWSRVNLLAADYAERNMRDQYLLVRFEDLCASPVPTTRRVLNFCGLEADAATIARDQVVSSTSIGRWRNQSPKTIAQMCELARPALRRFGYWEGGATEKSTRTSLERAIGFEQALLSKLSAGLGGHAAERYRLVRHAIRTRIRRTAR